MRDRTTDLLSRLESLEVELGRLRALALTQAVATDAATTPTPTEHIAAEPSSRRDLLRYGAVALGAAAAAAGMTVAPADAANGDPVIIGGQNTGTSSTYLNTTTLGYGFHITANQATYGLVAVGASRDGVYADTISELDGHAGVVGVSESSTGAAAGVVGVASSPSGAGVHGIHQNGGNAIRAEVPSNAIGNAIALYALNYSQYTGRGPGAGGFAIYGLSAKGHGLVGATATSGGAAVVGASNGVAGAFAAAFYGPVVVSGDFTVFGAKSAAVPHPDGSHRRLYCVESPESWFEDFGRGTLACGEATVALDPDFAAVVDASDYHVFLTGYDGRSDLSVCDRSSDGFRVRGSEGAEGTFSWRVVAKRKDIAGPRLERVEIPKEPTLPDVPASVYAPPPAAPPDLPRMAVPPRRPNGKP